MLKVFFGIGVASRYGIVGHLYEDDCVDHSLAIDDLELRHRAVDNTIVLPPIFGSYLSLYLEAHALRSMQLRNVKTS